MQKILLCCVVLTAATGAAHAQTGVRLGLKAGGALTSITGEYAQNAKSKAGVLAGLVARVGLTRRLAVQPELLYEQKGLIDTHAPHLVHRLNYLDLPVLVRYEARAFFLEAGPQVGWLLAAKQVNAGYALDTKYLCQPVDVGYAVGGGHQFGGGFGIGLRYNGGFTTISRAVEIGAVRAQAVQRNSAFQLSATYLFGAK